MQSVIDKVHDSKSLIVAEPEKSVLKATRHEMAPPKEKHVRKVVLYCNNNNPIAPLHSALDHRLRATAAWPVTLSTLVLYHRVLRDCPYRVMDFFRSRPLSVVPDPPTSEDCPQCYFASLYSRYIDSKIIISKVVGNCAWDKEEATKLQNLPQARLLEVSDTLISSLEALVRCYCADEIRSWEENIDPITVAALVLLVKDSVSLYKYVNMCLLSILESYFNMDLVSARQSLKLLQSFETCTKHLNKLYHCCSRFIENLETLDVPQKSLIPTLEAYIQTKEREDNNTRTQVRAAMPSSAEQVVFQPPPSSSTTRPLTSSGNVTIKPPSTSTTASPRQRDLLDFNDFTPQPSPQSLQQSPMRSQPFPPQNFQVSEQNLVLQQQQQQQQQLLQLQQEQLRLQQIQMQQQSNLFFSPSTPSSSSFSSTGILLTSTSAEPLCPIPTNRTTTKQLNVFITFITQQPTTQLLTLFQSFLNDSNTTTTTKHSRRYFLTASATASGIEPIPLTI
ncbi:phosphatidylinositol-binding clathrin assembly protein [Pelomyxa schiedti]|nr:phosphatidylinositol-binding clathrin assembly protein [Pelomyxa schiedti]